MLDEGKAFNTLVTEAKFPYTDESKACIHAVVEKLRDNPTSMDRPGMLLGMVQSGKTQTFLGAIALGLDNGFTLFVVLTKGTKALARQTEKRLKKAFKTTIEDDELRVFDVMSLPKITPYEQARPMIIVAKKQKDNLKRLVKAICEDYPELSQRRAVIIDDEADFASVGFKRSKSDVVEAQKIMTQIDDIRQNMPNACLLQTTATPYSLYLQPSKLPAGQAEEFKPVRPAFTVLVPIRGDYIGGQYYFEKSLIPDSVASYLYRPVDPLELEALHHSDGRKFKPDAALTSNSIPALRQAIVTFVVGGLLRRLQLEHENERKIRYSFIIHTESSRGAHQWQETVVEAILERLREAAQVNDGTFLQLVHDAYDDLARSVGAAGFYLPDYDTVLAKVEEYLPAIQVEKVNSENDINRLLDDDGQLELRNPLNIFIGGQILDRGITVANLIGFYYGRRATRFQQDTVLQHSRMYGARPPADLAVTRFYTSPQIYQVLSTIHEFDAGLWTAFENGGQEAGVVFIQQEGNRIIPCSPNKVLMSTLTTVRPGRRLLPVGFQTGSKTKILKRVEEIDVTISSHVDASDGDLAVLIDLDVANALLDAISKTLKFEEGSGYEWNVDAVKACLKYVIARNCDEDGHNSVYLLVRKNRDNARMRADGMRFFDAPDTAHVEGAVARSIGTERPVLALFRQNGGKDRGWRDCPFWWPVVYMPQNMRTVVFAEDTTDNADVDDLDDDA